MRKAVLAVIFIVFLLNMYSQENIEKSNTENQVNVPEDVKKAFALLYPEIAYVKWDIEKTNAYEGEFKLHNFEMSVVFDEKGILLETEWKIKESDLPQAIAMSFSKEFDGYKINEVEETDDNEIITYEMEAKKDGKEFILVYDKNGNLLEQKEDKE
jgi:hypothetical protein